MKANFELTDAPNAAVAPCFHAGDDWRGIGDPCRWAE